MPPKITTAQRGEIVGYLGEGLPREAIAKVVGVTPAQVAAVAAHITMGTYDKERAAELAGTSAPSESAFEVRHDRSVLGLQSHNIAQQAHVLLGKDGQEAQVWWNPSPQSNTANPHLLIVGESGSGKTYTAQCICAEFAQQHIPVIVFDYAQGFVRAAATPEFRSYARPVELDAARDGLDINPLSIFPSDIYGPVSVAQRVADTFARVYPKIGVQQHAVLRDAILAVFEDHGIRAVSAGMWKRPPPSLIEIRDKLNALANDRENPSRRIAASVASHISTFFVFNTFRGQGIKIDWHRILTPQGRTFLIQLNGLAHSLQRIVTELLLWNFFGYLESSGPRPLRCFILLDEAHRLSFDENSPVERILREGRKFGVGVILASQQPEDFSSVAYSNTASKIIFNLLDRTGYIARQITLRASNRDSIVELIKSLGTLPRGTAIFIGNQEAKIVKIAAMTERRIRWCTRGENLSAH